MKSPDYHTDICEHFVRVALIIALISCICGGICYCPLSLVTDERIQLRWPYGLGTFGAVNGNNSVNHWIQRTTIDGKSDKVHLWPMPRHGLQANMRETRDQNLLPVPPIASFVVPSVCTRRVFPTALWIGHTTLHHTWGVPKTDKPFPTHDEPTTPLTPVVGEHGYLADINPEIHHRTMGIFNPNIDSELTFHANIV